ncbi:MAG: hypothetical protein IPK04_21945 [Bdellovibrionales bacterium]|nr:hypothetical protein [Bdellovibrionales bacterium]
MYKLSPSKLSEVKYISSLTSLLTSDEIDLYHEADEEFGRVAFDGVITLIGKINSKKIGVILTDFRVAGGSFSKKNSKRTGFFIQKMTQAKMPIVFIFNSLGVRFMQGRTVFDDSFSIISDLYHFRKDNLLVTIGLGNVLGISALFFAQGHIRIALQEETQLNLTGPEVHKKFFGKTDAEFSQFTTAEHQFGVNSLVHEILPSQECIFRSVQETMTFLFAETTSPGSGVVWQPL